VLDDHTVSVTFARASGSNLYNLQLGWLPMHVFTDGESYDWQELDAHEFNGRPTVFSGAFVLQEWDRGDQWTVVRNDRYWRGAPHLEGVTNVVVDGQEAMIALIQEGSIDVSTSFDPLYLPQLKALPNLRIYRFLSDGYDFIAFNLGNPADPQPRLLEDGSLNEAHGTHPILADRLVRYAIVHAIDRDALIARARLGEGVPLHANVLPTVSWAYNTDLEPRAFDPETAGQLLDQAGWTLPPSGAVRTRDGQPLKLQLATNGGNGTREIMAQQIQEQLAQVGIDLELIIVDWQSLIDLLTGETFDLVLTSWDNLGIDPHDERLWSAENDLRGSRSNFVSYYDPSLEAMYDLDRTLLNGDQQERAELYRRIQLRLYESQPYCWIDVPRQLVAIDERVGGANPGPWNVWHNVHEWYIAK
jgi:peptide/nickel transport system substrate-binding protein